MNDWNALPEYKCVLSSGFEPSICNYCNKVVEIKDQRDHWCHRKHMNYVIFAKNSRKKERIDNDL